MRHRRIEAFVLFLLIGSGTVHAQQAVLPAGNEASGTGGTASYSIGQVLYTTNEATTGASAQGVQQPYEIYITTGTQETGINLSLSAYPNPTRDMLTLSVDVTDGRDLSYRLYDLQGQTIDAARINAGRVTMDLRNLPAATYVLEVIDRSQSIKIFKIIKS